MFMVTYSCTAGTGLAVWIRVDGTHVKIIEKGQKQVQTVPHIIKHKKGELL